MQVVHPFNFVNELLRTVFTNFEVLFTTQYSGGNLA